MTNYETVINLTQRYEPPSDLADRQRLIDAYLALSRAEGQRLVQYALDLGGDRAKEIRDTLLTNIGYLRPECLQGFHDRFLGLKLYRDGVLFRGAPPGLRDRLLTQVSEHLQPKARPGQAARATVNELLARLGWIGDAAVAAHFDKWQLHPFLPAGSRPRFFAHEAGWEPDEQSAPRSLYFEQCFELVIAEASTGASERCGRCGQDLVPLFDFDLADSRLAFLNVTGSRLCVPICAHCTFAARPLYANIDWQGRHAWSAASPEPETDETEYLQQKHWKGLGLALGAARRSPFLSTAMVGTETSQVGGFPAWVQDAEVPDCPECRRGMDFLAQLDCMLADVPYLDGVIYAFVCRECQVAATTYQAT